jgi:hypothetical protein
MTTKMQSCAKPTITPILSFTPLRSGVLLQRKCVCGGTPGPTGECEECRKKRLQRKSTQPSTFNSQPAAVPPIIHDVLRSPGQSLDAATCANMEPRYGYDFSRVRVHVGGSAAASAAAVHAKAYTVGNHIVFGVADYSPTTSEGQRLLLHELTHVVQQDAEMVLPDRLSIGAAGGALEAQATAAETAGSRNIQANFRTAAGVIQRDVLPVAKFSPAPGLFVDRTEKSVSISGAMELFGPEANAARASSIQNSINTTWTHGFPDGYAVVCNITVTYRSGASGAGNATQIEAENISGPSHVSPGLGGRSMTLNASERDAFTWTPAHEFGHIIELKDRYSESIMSEVGGTFGGTRTTTAHPGYESNLMAVSGGGLESKNIKDVAEENEPSQYWTNDDDQVRDWVNGHPLSDVAKLSTANKLNAIRTLMGGWISDDDVSVISRICSSVSSKTEADAIRGGVNLLDMTDLGQRTLV